MSDNPNLEEQKLENHQEKEAVLTEENGSTDGKPSYRRTSYFVKKGFQTRLTVKIMFMVLFVTIITSFVIYYFGSMSLDPSKMTTNRNTGDILLPVIVGAEIVGIIIVVFISLFVTHTIAGPVYRIENVSKAMGQGNFSNWIKFRSNDEMHDLAAAYNGMTTVFNDKFKEIRNSVYELDKLSIELSEKNQKSENVKEINKKLLEATQKLKEQLDYFKTSKEV